MNSKTKRTQRAADLYAYFESCTAETDGSIGMEVETSFVDKEGRPITVATSQNIFHALVREGWRVEERKAGLIAKIVSAEGHALLYELGRQNIELATNPGVRRDIVSQTRRVLSELYLVAEAEGAFPRFAPMLESNEDLLVIPDERDAGWLTLDGREALRPLATITSVQFTIAVTPKTVISMLNKLSVHTEFFLHDYPQDEVWKTYIQQSRAGYRMHRYGGPLRFCDLHDYCGKLIEHDVVTPNGLTPIGEVEDFSIPLFLRSIWWYFRLRRYGDQLCIEVRPLPRRTDELFCTQLDFVLNAMGM